MEEKLMLFGLTRQEAAIYICLYEHGPLNGYEASKLTGISRSNVYGGLSGLTEKGAAYVLEGEVKKYIAVPIGEICDNRIRLLNSAGEALKNGLKKNQQDCDGYITITGASHIRDKMFTMLENAEKRVYLSLGSFQMKEFEDVIAKLIKRDIKVVLLTDRELPIKGATFYISKNMRNQVHLIVDSQYVLTGDYSDLEFDTCLYSGQKNFVDLMKNSLKNEIKLIELGVTGQ